MASPPQEPERTPPAVPWGQLNATETSNLLAAVREGDIDRINACLTSATGTFNVDTLAAFGTALHAAAYLGRADVAAYLIKRGADVNRSNREGDTPLHKAAFTGRAAVLEVLLDHPDIDLLAENGDGKRPIAVARNREFIQILERAQRDYVSVTSAKLLDAGRKGDAGLLSSLLMRRNARMLNLNLRDKESGNTLLHYAAMMGNHELVVRVLQQGGSVGSLNKQRQTPADVAKNDKTRQLLHAHSFASVTRRQSAEDMHIEGPLERWSGYTRGGYKKRYFSIENGILFYYNSMTDVKGASRGSMRLHGAQILVNRNDRRTFTVRSKNETYHLRAESPEVRQEWLKHLAEASKGAVVETDAETAVLSPLQANGEPCYSDSLDVLLSSLQWQRQSFDRLVNEATAALPADSGYAEKLSSVSRSLVDLVQSLATTAEQRADFWKRKYQQEDKRARALEDSLRALAVEQNDLQKQVAILYRDARSDDDDDDDPDGDPDDNSNSDTFYDASDLGQSDEAAASTTAEVGPQTTPVASTPPTMQIVRRRTALPAPMKDRSQVSLWQIIKDFVGKDISKIAVPVYFNEPLSFLQKFSEDLEYHELLSKAANAPDSIQRMLYVAAFAISPYSATQRVAKPFNPILGETFEMDRRDDFGYRYFAEQVSHHPPISACHCESDLYTYWAEAHVQNRFRGNTLEIEPRGQFHLTLHPSKEHYHWRRVKTCVHNLIVGSIWVESYGTMEIHNAMTGERCHLEFKPRTFWGKNYAEVEGTVFDAQQVPQYRISGAWNSRVIATPAKGDGKPIELWRALPLPANAAEYYQFSQFAMELNELLPGMDKVLPRSDSRLRPDQRAMEDGDLDLAVSEKVRVEEKQRAARRELAARGEEWRPRWFQQEVDQYTGEPCWIYKGSYWESRETGQWTGVPDIF